MPPQGARRPDEATYQRLQSALESHLDAAAAAHPNPGGPILHRLNRSEYANAVRDLLDLDVDVASLLPPDDSAYGFDNISDVLGVSPSLPGKVPVGGREDRGAAVGNPEISCRQRHVPHPPGRFAGHSISTGCRSARSAARPCDTRFRWMATTSSRRSSTAQISTSCGASSTRTMSKSLSTAGASIWRPSAAETIWSRCSTRRPTRATPWTPGSASAYPSPPVRTMCRWRSWKTRRWPNRSGCSRFCAARSTTSIGRAAAHPDVHDHGAVQRHRLRRHAEPAQIFACRPKSVQLRSRVRRADSLDAGAPRLPCAGRPPPICSA